MLRLLLCAALLFGCAFSGFAQNQNYNLQLRSTLSFPNQTLANICGYWQNGREYALLGASKGLIIVDITNPDQPVTIVQIPGPNNLWKEIKVYQHYAYVTSEGGQGVQIVDLQALPSATLNYHSYTGSGIYAGKLNRIHSLHIDIKKGFLYTYGSSDLLPQSAASGAVVHDLKADPYNPTYVGEHQLGGYVHDGYVDNDTLYACHINSGQMEIVDMTDKDNPKQLGLVETPSKFTHNSWLLGDRKHVLTTDERLPSFVTCYDVSDPTDIRELDRISTTVDGANSVGHNTHVLNDYAITSWYTDGVTIIDAHRPDNLVQVARYDTYATPVNLQDPFDGCWGAFPYFPSGTIVTSDIPVQSASAVGLLTVLTPTYKRACYLEGKVLNGCNGQPLIGATIQINSTDPNNSTLSKITGEFKMGQVTPGTFTATISKAGFKTQVIPINLKTAEVTEINATLEAENLFNAAIVLTDALTKQPIANRTISLAGTDHVAQNLQSNAAGEVTLTCFVGDTYQVGTWGYLPGKVTLNANGQLNATLTPGYYDAFGLDLGWKATATASSGFWTRAEPVGTSTTQGGVQTQCNPNFDVTTDDNDQCYDTGNAGGGSGADDVDNGDVTLTSPPILLGAYKDAVLTFAYWFYNGGGSGNPNDQFQVKAVSNGVTAVVLTQAVSASEWRLSGDIHLKDFFPNGLSDDLKIQFITGDQAPGHVVEAAVDEFKLVPVQVSATRPDLYETSSLQASPNPSEGSFVLRYEWAAKSSGLCLEVRNVLGQLVQSQPLSAQNGVIECGNAWPKGVYFATLRSEEAQGIPLQLVRN